MNNIETIIDNIRRFPKIGKKKEKLLFDLIEKEEDTQKIKKVFKPDKSYDAECIKFESYIEKTSKEYDYVFLSWDLETTSLIEGWKDYPDILLASFAIFGLKGRKTKLIYNFTNIKFIEAYVTTSYKELKSILNKGIEKKNVIFIGWNISGFDHLVIENKFGKDFSDQYKNLMFKRRSFDGFILAMLYNIAKYGDLRKKFSLQYTAYLLLGEELDKDIATDFLNASYEKLNLEHVKYSLKDSIIAGFVIFRQFQLFQEIEEEIYTELLKLGTFKLAKKCGFLTHNIQYLANYSLAKVSNNGHAVDLERILLLSNKLEYHIHNVTKCLYTGKLAFCEKKGGGLEIWEQSIYEKDVESEREKLFTKVTVVHLNYGYNLVNDLEKGKLSKNEVLKYVYKQYYKINVITQRESNQGKKDGIDMFHEEKRAISKSETKKMENAPNLQGEYWMLKFGVDNIEDLIHHDIIIYFWFKVEKLRSQLAFIKSYIPHYSKLSKKYKALNYKFSNTLNSKKELMKVKDLFRCWGIDLTKEKIGRLYANFRTLLTSGRAGCTLPNIQQVERNQEIRDIFVAKDGYVLITSDYASIEMASEAQIYYKRYGYSKILELLNKGVDIHFYTGMLFRFPKKRKELRKILEDKDLLCISLKEGDMDEHYKSLEKKYKVTFDFRFSGSDAVKSILTIIFMKVLNLSKKQVKDIRQAAKPINFGVPGGMKPAKIRYVAITEYGINMTEKESEEAFRFFLRLYPEVKRWLDDSKNYSRFEEDPFFNKKYLYGCVTLSGRLRRIPDTNEGHNEWHNTQFQGLTADAVKLAVYKINRHPEMKVVNMIHDEIVVEVKEEDAKRLAKVKKKIMIKTMREFTPDARIDVSQEIDKCWRK